MTVDSGDIIRLRNAAESRRMRCFRELSWNAELSERVKSCINSSGLDHAVEEFWHAAQLATAEAEQIRRQLDLGTGMLLPGAAPIS
jgi:hypothetical protein